MATSEPIPTTGNITNWGWNIDSELLNVYQMISRAQFYVWFVICALIIPGNILTVLLVANNRQLHTPSNVLVAALAVADLLVGVTGIISPLVREYGNLCNVFLFTLMDVLSMGSISAASAHLFLIGADRYIAIVYPLRYEVMVTGGLVKKMVAVVWLITLSCGLTMFVWPFKNADSCYSNVPHEHIFSMGFIVYFGLAFFMVIIYTRIYLIARTHARRIQAVPTASSESKRAKKTNKTTKMFSYIMTAYFVAWTPYFICVLTQLLAYPRSTTGRIILAASMLLCVLLGLANSGMNFFVYAWTSRTFRRGYIALITCKKPTS